MTGELPKHSSESFGTARKSRAPRYSLVLAVSLAVAVFGLSSSALAAVAIYYDGWLGPGNTASSGYSNRWGHEICQNTIGKTSTWSSTPYPPDPMQYYLTKDSMGCAGVQFEGTYNWKITCRNRDDTYDVTVECRYWY